VKGKSTHRLVVGVDGLQQQVEYGLEELARARYDRPAVADAAATRSLTVTRRGQRLEGQRLREQLMHHDGQSGALDERLGVRLH